MTSNSIKIMLKFDKNDVSNVILTLFFLKSLILIMFEMTQDRIDII